MWYKIIICIAYKMWFFLSTLYDVRTIFHKIFEWTHSKIIFSHLNRQNRTINNWIMWLYPCKLKKLNYSFISICIITFFDVRTKIKITFYNILISNVYMYSARSNHQKIIIIFYSLLTYSFQILILLKIIFVLQSHSIINARNQTITFYNDVIWKCTFENET